LDLIKKFKDIEVGVTITTNDDKIRKVFEPKAPSIYLKLSFFDGIIYKISDIIPI